VTETISPMAEQIDAQQLAQQLVEKARAEGVDLVGPGGLLTGLTKTVLETALDAELSEHLGLTSTTRPAATAATPATAPEPRRC
jgi:putative transposase